NQLFQYQGNGKFKEVREDTLDRLLKVGRGAAFADLDGDGRIDIVVNNLDDQPTVLLNRCQSGNWIELKLVGRKSNRDAIGARAAITAGGKKQMAEARAGSSYLSQSDTKLHVGVAQASKVDFIDARWPRGGTLRLGAVEANKVLRVEEQ